MTDPRAMLETYASQPAHRADWTWDVESYAPEAVQALRAVLDCTDAIDQAMHTQPRTDGEMGMRLAMWNIRTAITNALGGDQ